ncbi:MAG: glycosyltransferase family 1 protein [Desulfobacteraceae bacterium]|nr:MAG: glycosyltransferase family 1 protein [Desulfobacteraceae bacterium]
MSELNLEPIDSARSDRPLRIGLLSYRGNPHCGGQGVYVRHLSHALGQLGHTVEVISGPPYPHLDNGARLHRLPSLDLYNPQDLFRTPTLRELCNPINMLEWVGISTMGFSEPLTFGLRAYRMLKSCDRFDILHDNQCLSYGIWALARRIPTLATIHHPITVDRDMAIRAEKRLWKKAKHIRWYSFIGMQKRVARTLNRIITVSAQARDDISREFRIPPERFSVVPNGIDTTLFHPLPGLAREPFRLIVTNSADIALKGLHVLLRAMATLVPGCPGLHLVVVGMPKEKSPIFSLIRELGLGEKVQFTGRIDQDAFVRHYARAWAAVVPSLYEGFGLPAGEAMACAVPVISTTGGALPEVVGDAGLLVPPGDHLALAKAIALICDHPHLARTLGRAGYERVMANFTWQAAARQTVCAYRTSIDDYRRFSLS